MTLAQLGAPDASGGVRDLQRRAAVHTGLGDPTRLTVVDELVGSDRSPAELRPLTGLESNLLAHHLDVLEGADLIVRQRSGGAATSTSTPPP